MIITITKIIILGPVVNITLQKQHIKYIVYKILAIP